MFGLSEAIIKQIVDLVTAYKPPEKIVIFGSRAHGDFKTSSDIDIAIFAKTYDSRDINLIKDRLEEELKTPLKLDVLNFYDISKNILKENILKKGKVIYEHAKV